MSTNDSRPTTGGFHLLGGANFRWFFVARTISVMASSMSPVALAFAVLELTGRAQDLALVLSASVLPTIVLLVLGGGLADRFPRNTVLWMTHVVAALSQGVMAGAVLLDGPVWVLIGAALLNGAVQAFMRPALVGILPEVVDKADLQSANSLLATSRNTASLLGPAVAGGAVVAVGGGWTLATAAIVVLVAGMCLTRVKLPARALGSAQGIVADLREGWTYFRTASWLWTGTLVFALTNAVLMGVWGVLGPVLAEQSFGAATWGIVLSAKAAGLLVMSAVLVGRRGGRSGRHPYALMMVWLSVSASPLVALGVSAPVPVLVATAAVAGLGSAYSGIVWDSERQRRIPNEMLSRASSYDDVGAFGAIPIGQLGVIPVAAAVGQYEVAVLGGLVYAAVPLVALLLLYVRRSPRNL